MTGVLDIACDEAGHTGPDLLQQDQRYFAFGSVSMSDQEAFEVIQRARRSHPVQMPELKASRLLGSNSGIRLVQAIFEAVEGRYTVLVHDKLLALCGWFFEYIYEPVFKDDPRLLYQKNLHRFVAMYAWLWMNDPSSEAKAAIEQFQRYMRSKDPADAPYLFATPHLPPTEDGHPFQSILAFAFGYRDRIIADNARLKDQLPDEGKWTLDLSASGLWSNLNHWGKQGKSLRVTCDASKPLRAIASQFTGDFADAGLNRARMLGHKGGPGWKSIAPVSFGDSRNHPALQLADVIAGTATSVLAKGMPDQLRPIIESIDRHRMLDCILPELERVDPTKKTPMVNSLILYDLAQRAVRQSDPLAGLAEMYALAEAAFDRGAFAPRSK